MTAHDESHAALREADVVQLSGFAKGGTEPACVVGRFVFFNKNPPVVFCHGGFWLFSLILSY